MFKPKLDVKPLVFQFLCVRLPKWCFPHQWCWQPAYLLTLSLWHFIFLGGLLAGFVKGLDEVGWKREKYLHNHYDRRCKSFTVSNCVLLFGFCFVSGVMWYCVQLLFIQRRRAKTVLSRVSLESLLTYSLRSLQVVSWTWACLAGCVLRRRRKHTHCEKWRQRNIYTQFNVTADCITGTTTRFLLCYL